MSSSPLYSDESSEYDDLLMSPHSSPGSGRFQYTSAFSEESVESSSTSTEEEAWVPPSRLKNTERSYELRSRVPRAERQEMKQTLDFVIKREKLDIEYMQEQQASIGIMPDLKKTILSVLECPICLEYATPPIPQCLEGHIICSTCRNQVSECPVCRGNFINTRSKALEGICDITRVGCSHRDCNAMVPLPVKAYHSITCEHRVFSCIFDPTSKCQWQGKKESLLAHGLNRHRDNVYVSSRVRERLGLHVRNPKRFFVMVVDDDFFLVTFAVDLPIGFAPTYRLLGNVKLLCHTNSNGYKVEVRLLPAYDIDIPHFNETFEPRGENSLDDEESMETARFKIHFDDMDDLLGCSTGELIITIST